MQPVNLRERLQSAEPIIGSIVSVDSPDVAEVMSLVGFDYLWIEAEHAPLGFAEVQTLIQAIGGRCPSLVRIPDNAEVWFKKALDTGCDGLVVPQVKTADEARRAVKCAYYPPLGARSVGITRAQGYGTTFTEYVETINDRLLLVLQIEHATGVENVDEIVAVPGIGAILVGPFDLSGSLGLLGQTTHPEVEERIEAVRAACERAGVPVGIFAVDAATARRYIDRGFKLVCLSSDTSFMHRAATSALRETRGERP
jgi:2-dehydro-3-deoxyglucarate aldolase/4-hydroxy-2-oxoheptanedioate aldolase